METMKRSEWNLRSLESQPSPPSTAPSSVGPAPIPPLPLPLPPTSSSVGSQSLANDLSIPRLVFYSSDGLLASVFNDLWLRQPRLALGNPGAHLLSEDSGLPILLLRPPPIAPRPLQGGLPEVGAYDGGSGRQYRQLGAVLNTVCSLEGALSSSGPGRGAAPASHPVMNRGGQSSVPHEDINAWLDELPKEGSVCFIC